MTPISEIIFSGFVSKVVNDVIDISKDKIKKAVKSKVTKHQNLESQIYNVTVDVLNKITNNRYENNQESIYDAAEVLLKSFEERQASVIESQKVCLQILNLNVSENECVKFKVLLCQELSKDKYGELFRAILLLQLEYKNKYDHVIYEQLNQKLDEVIWKLDQKKASYESNSIQKMAESRTQEYADKWNANMFLNNFDEWDENAGVNIKLSDVYLDEHLPHFIYGENRNESKELKKFLTQYIEKSNENKMLLILGQPGIGKSTLITWITANFNKRLDDILVYQFASDFKDIEWDKHDVSKSILKNLDLSSDDLNGKVLILDGYDEINISGDRKELLDQFYWSLVKDINIRNFSLIITCRVNYIEKVKRVKCKYIILRPWDEEQIKSFCAVFQEKTGINIFDDTIVKLVNNEEIFGIPLILYMVLALNISIEKEGSIVDVYDKIFSLEGGIYDRCIDKM